MITVVLDSNVYISALIFGGVPRQMLNLIYSQNLLLYTSQSIVDEVVRILSEKFYWSRQQIDLHQLSFLERCTIIKPSIRLRVCSDPDDNHVLECAQAARADFLVTGNTKHFPPHHETTRVVTPRQFLDLLLPQA